MSRSRARLRCQQKTFFMQMRNTRPSSLPSCARESLSFQGKLKVHCEQAQSEVLHRTGVLPLIQRCQPCAGQHMRGTASEPCKRTREAPHARSLRSGCAQNLGPTHHTHGSDETHSLRGTDSQSLSRYQSEPRQRASPRASSQADRAPSFLGGAKPGPLVCLECSLSALPHKCYRETRGAGCVKTMLAAAPDSRTASSRRFAANLSATGCMNSPIVIPDRTGGVGEH